MAMATFAATPALLSPPPPYTTAPPPRGRPPRPPLRLGLRLPRRRPVTTTTPAAAHAASSLSSARGDPREAEAAVAELLRDNGASPEDAAAIAARAPGYAAMLADGVRELDELGLWASWSAGAGARAGAEMGALGFGRKVYFMGRSRRDGAVVPLVESLGVRLSSAKLIAPYVAAEGLPVLIRRVKFFKEMLFSSSGYETLIGWNAKRMMAHFSIPADEALQSTLSFFEKMEARHGGLSMLAHGDVSFPYLIESFPMLLLCSEDKHLKALIDFLEHVGVPKPRIPSVLLAFPPIILSDVEKDIKPRIHAWEKAGIEQEYIGRMLLKYPWILSASVIENYKQTLLFFNRRKISSAFLGTAVKSWPHILGCSTTRMNSILVLFDDLGISKKMLVPVLTSSPQLLLRKPNEFLQIVSFFKDMGFDKKAVGKIVCRSPEIFASDLENTLKKKIDFLIDFGISERHLPRIIKKYPELLLLDINRTLLPRMNYFLGKGLSKKDVCSMISRFSPLLGYSIEHVLKPKLDFLLQTMKKPLKAVVEYPRYFSYSLEGRIKPRFWIIKSRHIDCSLTDMFGKNNELFAEEYLGIET
ncbi:transcription termination factor MTERF2, chloroplastic-like [Triticum dicoccoides]|uniref:transcription termination factor MTERF2, chloroplastic-like n=1 Tax=Triticum dicoccoides TaxID=85692 RepID=UPI001891D199|nr:transcription termination factor MTERF2, chloroplastic-like [Triticum dicoccoides]